jgi:hypothetical protein
VPRALLLALAVAVAACGPTAPVTIASPSASPSREPGTLAVTALLDLSGARSPKGDAQRAAMQGWTDQQRATVPRLRLKVVDVAGSDGRLVLELRRIAETNDADAVVVGVPVGLDDAISGALALLRRPVLFTLPLAEPTESAGDGRRWAFALAPTPETVARVSVSAQPATSPTVIVTDGSVLAGRDVVALAAELRRQGRPAPLVVSAAADQRDTFAPRLRAAMGAGAAVYFAGPPAPYLAPQRLVPSPDATTLGASLSFLGYLTEPADATRLGDAALNTRWPGPSVAATGSTDPHALTAADALAIVAAAATGTADPSALRDRIEGGTFRGIATTYSFGPSRHAGADPTDLALLAWANGRVVLARPPQAP